MYTFESRVRYSETDESGRLSVTGIMNYLQDCSTFQSEDLGLGLSYLKNKNRAWWLNSWQILIDRYPSMGDRICVSTWPYGFKGIFGYRNFTICDQAGNYLVRADSNWFFYDLEKHVPARVTEDEIRGYGHGEEALKLPEASRKIALPPQWESKESVLVVRHHLDTNSHVNNAQYVEIAREFLPERFIIAQLRVEYKNAAVLGDVIYPKVGRVPEGYVVSLQGEDGKVFANIWLARKREDEGHD